jgi:hypothetical protein
MEGRVMSEDEKKALLDELEKRFEEKYKGCLTREDVFKPLKEPREKWFKDENGGCGNSLMAEAFGSSIIAWQVWETIRIALNIAHCSQKIVLLLICGHLALYIPHDDSDSFSSSATTLSTS